MKQPPCNCHACCPPKDHCRCHPAKPEQACILLPRAIAQGRACLRHCPCKLEMNDLPACLPQPVTLIHVSVCADAAWEQQPCCHPRQLMLKVTIPLACTLRDGCGHCHTCHTQICCDLCMNLTCSESECWRSHAAVFPQVRLVCAEGSDGCCIHAQLEILVEGYLLRWEACGAPLPCKPACPQLPLYPQPCVLPCR